jgi:hypothetical protein
MIQILLETLFHENSLKKPREQYLGSLKESLNKTRKIDGSSTTPLQIRSHTNTKRTEKGSLKKTGNNI